MLDAVWALDRRARRRRSTRSEWKQPSECPGWTVQDNLVHLTALERFILGDPLPSGGRARRPPAREERHRQGERTVDRVAPLRGPAPTRSAEFRAATGTRIEQLRALDDAGFAADSWTPMGPGTVARPPAFPHLRLVGARAGHAARPRPARRPRLAGRSAGPGHDGRGAARTSSGRRWGPPTVPPSCSCSPDRSRPPPRWRWSTAGPAPLDPLPADPTVTLTLASDAFARLACGRSDPGEALVTGVVAIDGDVLLGGEIVRQLNYMF